MGPHGWQHARLPCPSLSLRICSVSCPLYQWCHPIILWWLDTSYLKCCAGPQSPYGLGPICRSIAFDAGKFPDKLQTLTSFPKSPRAESKCADALASYSKTSPSCRIFWKVWFQSKEFWAYTPLTPTLLHAEIKKKISLVLGLWAFGHSSGDPQTWCLYWLGSLYFLKTHTKGFDVLLQGRGWKFMLHLEGFCGAGEWTSHWYNFISHKKHSFKLKYKIRFPWWLGGKESTC